MASIQGAYYNRKNSFNLNINSICYIVGIGMYIAIISEAIYSAYRNKLEIHRIRVIVKGTLLSLLYINPIYFLSLVVGVDCCFISI